jgi:hypothetical protein
MNVQLKIVSENRQTVQATLDILKTVFPLHVESPIIPNDRDIGYHCLITVNPAQTSIEVSK